MGGPMHIRLFLQPLVALLLAIRAGLRDAREGKPAFLWEVISNPKARRELLLSCWQDVGRVYVAAFTVDIAYQLLFLRALYLLQSLIVAFVLAFLPYIIVRGPVTRISRRLIGKRKAKNPD